MTKQPTTFQAKLAIVFASLLWGTTGTAASFSPNVSALAIGAFSMGFGGLLLVLSTYKNILDDLTKITTKPKLLFIGGICIAIYPLAFYTSMKLSGVAIGTVLSIATAPFFSVLFERFINKKQQSLKWLVSFIFGVFGVVLMALGKEHGKNLEFNAVIYGWGICCGLIAGVSYATYAWCAKQMVNQGINAASSMASMFGFAAIILLPTLLFTGGNLFSSATNTLVALYMAIVPMFIGYLLFSFSIRFVETSEATLITLLEPVIATILALSIVNERFELIGWIGMALIAICILLQMINWTSITILFAKLKPSA